MTEKGNSVTFHISRRSKVRQAVHAETQRLKILRFIEPTQKAFSINSTKDYVRVTREF